MVEKNRGQGTEEKGHIRKAEGETREKTGDGRRDKRGTPKRRRQKGVRTRTEAKTKTASASRPFPSSVKAASGVVVRGYLGFPTPGIALATLTLGRAVILTWV